MQMKDKDFLLSKDDMEFVLEMIDQGIIKNSISDFTLRILAKAWYDRGYDDAQMEIENGKP
jgi:hypothetical protein